MKIENQCYKAIIRCNNNEKGGGCDVRNSDMFVIGEICERSSRCDAVTVIANSRRVNTMLNMLPCFPRRARSPKQYRRDLNSYNSISCNQHDL